jgi:hypothetical protein
LRTEADLANFLIFHDDFPEQCEKLPESKLHHEEMGMSVDK